MQPKLNRASNNQETIINHTGPINRMKKFLHSLYVYIDGIPDRDFIFLRRAHETLFLLRLIIEERISQGLCTYYVADLSLIVLLTNLQTNVCLDQQ